MLVLKETIQAVGRGGGGGEDHKVLLVVNKWEVYAKTDLVFSLTKTECCHADDVSRLSYYVFKQFKLEPVLFLGGGGVDFFSNPVLVKHYLNIYRIPLYEHILVTICKIEIM